MWSPIDHLVLSGSVQGGRHLARRLGQKDNHSRWEGDAWTHVSHPDLTWSHLISPWSHFDKTLISPNTFLSYMISHWSYLISFYLTLIKPWSHLIAPDFTCSHPVSSWSHPDNTLISTRIRILLSSPIIRIVVIFVSNIIFLILSPTIYTVIVILSPIWCMMFAQVHQTEVRTFKAAEGSQDRGMSSYDCSGKHHHHHLLWRFLETLIKLGHADARCWWWRWK